MAGRTFHIFNPKDNPYNNGPRKPPPEFYDGKEGKAVSKPLRSMLSCQREDGAFGWDGLKAGQTRHQFKRAECEELLRRAAPPKATLDDNVLSTASVIMAWRYSFRHSESHYYHDAERTALKWLASRAKMKEDAANIWLDLACRRWTVDEAQIAREWNNHFHSHEKLPQPPTASKIRYADRLFEKRRGVWLDVAQGRVVTPALGRHLDNLVAGGLQ